MKKNFLTFIPMSFLALLMFLTPVFFATINSEQTIKYSDDITQSRTIKTDGSIIDCESIFNSFDESHIETEGSTTIFEGIRAIDLLSLDGLDEVSQSTSANTLIKVKYKFSYDNETNIVTLTAVEIRENGDSSYEETIVDTILGIAFINEAGVLDAVLDVDGEYILLSELQNLGMVENCGWFRGLFKKVAKITAKVVVAVAAVVVVSAVAATVVASCGAALPAVIAAGAVAGGVTGGIAGGVISYQETGKVSVAAVAGGAVAGAVIGGLVGKAVGTAFGLGVKAATDGTTTGVVGEGTSQTIGDTVNESASKITGQWQQVNESMSQASRAYQTQITGHTGEAFIQNGVKFDGVINGNLVDAKCHYSQFVDKSTGQFYEWFDGKQALIDEANRQIYAAQGAKIQWYFAEEEAMNAVQRLFDGTVQDVIEFIFKAALNN